jgi:membrane protease subunit (stomatin/prohibitin family)
MYGTQNPIRYKDANYNNAMLAVTSNGTYSLQIVDPILFIKNFVPADVVSGQGRSFYSLDATDDGTNQDMLFSGFVGSLAAALSAYTKNGKSIDDIQGGTVEFAQAVDEAVEATYQWGTKFGLKIASVEPRGLDWDQPSIDLINKFNTGMLMQGTVGQAYAQTQVAEGLNAAGNNGAGAFMGVGMGAGMVGMNGNFGAAAGQNPVAGAQPVQPQQPVDPTAGATPAAE